MIVLEGDRANVDQEIDEGGKTSSEESLERAGRHPRVCAKEGKGKDRKTVHHENLILESKRVGGIEGAN
jgi:hypothetical protein